MKNKLSLEALNVESFETAAVLVSAEFLPTRGQNAECNSWVDACPTRLCETTYC